MGTTSGYLRGCLWWRVFTGRGSPRSRRHKPAERPQSRTPSNTVEGELLAFFAEPSLARPIAVFMALGVVGLIASNSVSFIWIAAWMTTVAAVLYARWWISLRLPTTDIRLQARRLRIAMLLAGTIGAVYAVPVFFFPWFTVVEQALVTTVILGLCTGAVATIAGYPPILFSHLCAGLGGVVVGWLFLSEPTQPDWMGEAFALTIVAYAVLLMGQGRNVYSVFRESFEIRLQQRELNRQLQVALEKAEAANQAKTRFLASASHDLRQPIHTLSLFGAALSMHELSDEAREITRHMDAALQTLASQLDTLLDISKLDAGIVQPNTQIIDLRPLLARMHEEFVPLFADKGLRWNLDAPSASHTCTDPLLLDRIVRNLLSNAVRYTDAGTVGMALTQHVGSHVIRITDTGSGIPEDQQERIFEEFYQLENPERDRAKGLGLGLAIVRRLADMLNVDLTLQSTPGVGTTFELRLPVAGTPLPTVPAPSAPKADPANATGLAVLVIEDEAAVRTAMQTLLQAMQHTVTLADSTEQAVALARQQPPDIVLADLRLRGKDSGIHAIRALRAFAPGLPALLITGDTAPDRLREAHAARIPLLHKPVTLDQLRGAIGAVFA